LVGAVRRLGYRFGGSLDGIWGVAAGVLAVGIGLAPVLAQAQQSQQQQQNQQQKAQPQRGGQLEEIVVTARFRQENLEQTPLAISAFSAQDLNVRDVTNIDQVGAVVPNAYIRPGGVAPTIGIRGVIASDFIYATEPAVGVYIDDVYFGTLAGSALDLSDIQRIEVLRGPQGTLFGKNSLGGAIRIITKKPQGDNTGYLQATYGSYNRLDLRGAFDLPLIENKLALRVEGMSKRRDGYIDQLDFTCEMIAEGTPELAGIGDGIGGATQVGTSPFGTPIYAPVMVTPGSAADNNFSFPVYQPSVRKHGCKIGTERGIDKRGARAGLRFTPGSRVDALFTLDYLDDNSEAFGSVMKEPRAFPLDGLMVSGIILPQLGIPDIGARFDRPEHSYQTFENFSGLLQDKQWPPVNGKNSWGFSNTLDVDLTDNVHMKWVGSYRKYHAVFTTGDNLPIDMTTTYNILDHHQRTGEFQFSGNALKSRLAWTTGLFYYDATSALGGRVHLQPFNYLGIIPEFDQNDSFHTTNRSLFVHTVWNLTSQLSLTAGARYTKEKKEYTFDHTGFLTVATPAVSSTSRTDWLLGFNYNFNDSSMIYATAATGFRSAGFQPRPWTPGQLQPFPQEQVKSYEFGFKGDIVDNRLRLNADVFYMNYDPRVVTTNAAQCTPFNSPDPGTPVFGPLGGMCPPGTPLAGQNGWNWFAFFSAPGKVKGVELELTANPVENVTLNLSVGTNKFTSNVSDPTALGYRNPDSLIQPEVTASGGFQYEFHLGGGATLTPRLDWTYTSHNTNSAPAVEPDPAINIIPSYSLFNGRLTYQTENQDWSLALAVSNLRDKFYWYDFGAPGGQNTTGSPGEPRMWTVQIRRNFQ
jgi:iron complex outermembrane receptor protein